MTADARLNRLYPALSAKARARKIKLLLLDVDGVMTDGRIFFLPIPPGALPVRPACDLLGG